MSMLQNKYFHLAIAGTAGFALGAFFVHMKMSPSPAAVVAPAT